MLAPMEPSLTDALCTHCGLCCDGSLFADVELAGPAEADGLELMGLEIDHDDDSTGGLMVLPCRALRGTRCSIYAHRPRCCRTFECGLLQNARRGTVSVAGARADIAEARARVAAVKELLAQLGVRVSRLSLSEACAEALTRRRTPDSESQRTRAELEVAIAGVELWIQHRFLAGERKRCNGDP